ncbi:hypothetical protein ACFXOL_20990 [Streptomyces californicus]|uniref:hypothetical protein n=1 Tax=Streptomyces californicus TaxID=67351 RepID=UPI003667A0FE
MASDSCVGDVDQARHVDHRDRSESLGISSVQVGRIIREDEERRERLAAAVQEGRARYSTN